LRLSDIEPRCTACGKRGADVRPDFHWKGMPKAMMDFDRPRRAENTTGLFT
jgi:NAD-dependent SIR2 family protein deacetylase